jgi:transketolase
MSSTQIDLSGLQNLSRHLRIDSLVAIYHAGSGHPGGALSAADLMAYLSSKVLGWPNLASENDGRSRFVLSKGHACPVFYSAAAECGLIPRSELLGLRKLGSPLQGHPHVLDTPWVETSTGSLGQGFSASIGMALGLRYQKLGGRVYVMLGDGELQEGEIWEGAMCAGHYKLDNLCAILDYNQLQSDDLNESIMGIAPVRAKWEAFRWHVIEIDGHDFGPIASSFEEAAKTENMPTLILANTVKGKGVSFMENSPLWHGSVKLRDDELERGLRELHVSENDLGRYLDGSIWQNRSH